MDEAELDEEERKLLESPFPPTAAELKGKMGRSLAATVRGFWEQTGWSEFAYFPVGDNIAFMPPCMCMLCLCVIC